MRKPIAITGANGFIGSALLRRLRDDSCDVRPITRSHPLRDGVTVGSMGAETDWSVALEHIESVIHCAALVDVNGDTELARLRYRETNVDGTLNLVRQAASAGVKRFVFLSTVKVLGEETSSDAPFQADDPPQPFDLYAISKREAEDGLKKIAQETGMEVVIIRPPLVYGPGVKGNFGTIMRWIAKGIPLPLGAIQHNRRSLVALDNLVDLIVTCIDHPAAANEVFLVSDGEDLSTTALLRRLAHTMDKPSRLLPVPARVLEAMAKATGKGDMARRLCGSLRVDISKTRTLLGWSPPVPVDQGLRDAVQRL